MHITGMLGMPRRIYTYPSGMGWDTANLIITGGAYVFAIGVVLFLIDLVRSLRVGPLAGNNPWDAPTLEWSDDVASTSVQLRGAAHRPQSLPAVGRSDSTRMRRVSWTGGPYSTTVARRSARRRSTPSRRPCCTCRPILRGRCFWRSRSRSCSMPCSRYRGPGRASLPARFHLPRRLALAVRKPRLEGGLSMATAAAAAVLPPNAYASHASGRWAMRLLIVTEASFLRLSVVQLFLPWLHGLDLPPSGPAVAPHRGA